MNYRYIVSAIIQDGDRIILGKKAKGAPPYPDVWHLPGGGVEDMEKARLLCEAGDFDNAYFHTELRREVAEEVGVEITNIRNIIPEFRSEPRQGDGKNKNGEPTHYYFLEYLCDYASGEPRPGDDLAEVRWVQKSDLQHTSVTPPSVEMYKELGWIV
jgi:ADP-ribose pyrophosphatase YjhB (NUDIX family)